MSLRDLAAHLGLSQTTVSRALNGYPEVSEATRRRVQEEAARMNYAPNARAKSLATGRAMAVGHVISAASQHEIVNPVFADFVAGASTVYAKEGYDMMLTLVPDDDVGLTYRRFADRGRVDGVIVQSPMPNDSRIALLREIGMPFVVHGRAFETDMDYSWIDMDNARAFARATRHLIELGHRRIALLNGLEGLNFAIRRRTGYLEAMAEAGLPVQQGWIRNDQMSEPYGHAAASELLDGPEPPTAFLASALLVAVGIRRACEARGLQLGRDVSVVAHDDGLSYLPNGLPEAPVFTATRAPVPEAGRIAAEMLLSLIARPDQPPMHRTQTADLVIGPSSGPARSA